MGLFLGLLWASRDLLGASWGPLGGLVRPLACWGPPGGALGASWGLLGGLLGPLRGLLGPLGSASGASGGLFGPSWGGRLEMSVRVPPLEPLLGPSWVPLGPSWSVGKPKRREGQTTFKNLTEICDFGLLGQSWDASWGSLGASWGPLGPSSSVGSSKRRECKKTSKT